MREGDPSIVQKSVVMASVATLLPWLANAVIINSFAGGGGQDGESLSNWVLASFSMPLVLVPVVTMLMDTLTVLALSAAHRFRSDQWWLVGALFATNPFVPIAAVDAANSSGGYAGMYTLLSFLSGQWILAFAVGALMWRRLTPTFIPVAWVKPEDPEEE